MADRPGETDYRRKIKTLEELRELIGPRPRARTVIMCHGVFDLVHPGHIRHLMYAKGKADILVASLTCDAHIEKAAHRPFVPQELRAMNLAALEMVDYVLIDQNPTPIENLLSLQPDYFAKGYEYTHEGLNPKTREEVAALERYGGEAIFTPGDVVFSSSAFIEHTPPKLSTEKLLVLMESEGVAFDDLRKALEAFASVRVHVVGDTIVDSYTSCTLIGGMAKTPTFSVKHERQTDFVGGAGVVAKHLRKAGAAVRFSTVLGNDSLKDFVLQDLAASGVACEPLIDHTRPTTQKQVFIAGGYRLLKVDRLDNRPIADRFLETLASSLSASDAEGFIFSDFRHGIFSAQSIPTLTASLPPGAFRAADSQVASRWGNILDFQGFDLITPNEREARFALGDQDSVIRPLGLELYKRARCKTLILKLGERGLMTFRSPRVEDVRAFFTIDSFAGQLVDPVGAGDALLAYATLALMATRSPVVASVLGAMAAAVACEREGNQPVEPADVLKKLEAVEQQGKFQYA
ncbi:MAG: adenylyltransferase/cytidyltransferase family protein [Candidatus Rokubacteria bacterium]|nr:adenylyltransferase/cytidyltransferase family protein [Candidatus Rokubacteria bacterium]